MGLGSVVWSQGIVYKISDFSGSYNSKRLITSDDELRIKDVLIDESFDNVIPHDWINENYDAENNLTSAIWEYRGPETIPSNAVGSRGSCEESGTQAGVPILSPTASDGFIIFDSDYWDSDQGDCAESLGSGMVPAPHYASLTTSSFDLSNQPYVGIILNQYLRNFNAAFKIQLSKNGGEFQDIYVSNVTSTNASCPRDMQLRKNISEAAGNQPDVRIRFYFEQMYYFWMIDDFKIVALEENNLEIESANHSSFVPTLTSEITSFEGLDYFIYPQQMPPIINANVKVANKGGVEQTNCTVDISVNQGATMIENVSSAALNIMPDELGEFSTSAIVLSSELASYDLSYLVTQDAIDDSPENNLTTRAISITENTLARDEGAVRALYMPSLELENTAYEVGAVYQPDVGGLEVHSISTALGIGTDTEATVYAAIYGIDVSNGLILDPVAISNYEYILPYELNDIGEEKMKVIPFNEPITLYEDSAYLAVVGTSYAANQVSFAFSGESYPYTSWVKYADNTVFFVEQTPIVRMNFGTVTSVNEISPVIEGSVYPNPTSNQITIDCSLEKASELTLGLFDLNGKLIENLYTGKKPAGNHQVVIDVSTTPSGVYLVKLISQYGKLEETLVIE